MLPALVCLALSGLPDLESHDWVTDRGTRFLSLRPGPLAATGTVWLLQSGKEDWEAFQGAYRYGEVDGVPRLRTSFCRRWQRRVDRFGDERWVFDSYYYTDDWNRGSFGLEVTETTKGVSLAVVQVSGATRSAEPDSSEAGSDAPFKAGEIITFAAGSDLPFDGDLLPGFVQRKDWQQRLTKAPKTVFHTQHLKTDWYGWQQDTQESGDVLAWLSLQSQEDAWHSGQAWLIVASGTDRSLSLGAARGAFTITSHANPLLETQVLQLSLPRAYAATFGDRGELEWSVADEFALELPPCGLTWHLPLKDRAFSGTRQAAYLDHSFYVDPQGRLRREYVPSGPLGLLKKERVPYGFGVLNEGCAFQFDVGQIGLGSVAHADRARHIVELVDATPPPGFTPRPRRIVQQAARPQLPDPPPDRTRSSATRPRAGAVSTPVRPQPPRIITTEDRISSLLRAAHQAYADGDGAAAIRSLETALQLNAKHPQALNDLAWVLATSRQEEVRDGFRAIELAVDACRLTDYENPYYLDTLAAACAERERFADAVRWQAEALRLASDADRKEIQSRLTLYESRRPYRQP